MQRGAKGRAMGWPRGESERGARRAMHLEIFCVHSDVRESPLVEAPGGGTFTMKTRLFVDVTMPLLYDAPAAGVGRAYDASCGLHTTSAARFCPH